MRENNRCDKTAKEKSKTACLTSAFLSEAYGCRNHKTVTRGEVQTQLWRGRKYEITRKGRECRGRFKQWGGIDKTNMGAAS